MSEIIQGYNWVGESEKPDSTIHECSFKSLLKSFIVNHNIGVIYILELCFKLDYTFIIRISMWHVFD